MFFLKVRAQDLKNGQVKFYNWYKEVSYINKLMKGAHELL